MKFYCAECASELSVFSEDGDFMVEPCSYCMDREWEDGFEDGQYAEEHEGGN